MKKTKKIKKTALRNISRGKIKKAKDGKPKPRRPAHRQISRPLPQRLPVKIVNKEFEFKGKEKQKLDLLIKRGHGKKYVTDLEILYFFPNIENNIPLLEKIYDILEKNNIGVIET